VAVQVVGDAALADTEHSRDLGVRVDARLMHRSHRFQLLISDDSRSSTAGQRGGRRFRTRLRTGDLKQPETDHRDSAPLRSQLLDPDLDLSGPGHLVESQQPALMPLERAVADYHLVSGLEV
jgi:hypothetical protein